MPKEGENMKSTKSIRYHLFMFLGLTRGYGPQNIAPHHIIEPEGARTSRRNIIALAGLLVLAGVAGADPGDLNVFGVEPGKGTWGVIVIGAAAIVVQVYWYSLKYFHLIADMRVATSYSSPEENIQPLFNIDLTKQSIAQKRANWLSNWGAFILAIGSWFVIICWIVSANTKGVAT